MVLPAQPPPSSKLRAALPGTWRPGVSSLQCTSRAFAGLPCSSFKCFSKVSGARPHALQPICVEFHLGNALLVAATA